MNKKIKELKIDCRYFKGNIPCKYHKKYKIKCDDNCKYYDIITANILIIKLGAIGDVIRTTPILQKLSQMYPQAKIFWLTEYAQVIPSVVDIVTTPNVKDITILRSTSFDVILNYDKDYFACSLTEQLNSTRKFGFGFKNGTICPLDSNAEHKFITGIDDELSKANNKHYLEEIFQIFGQNYSNEQYILPTPKENERIKSFFELGISNKSQPIIGLNTGCGNRWSSRLWPFEYWVKLAIMLRESGYKVILLGGKDEHKKNIEIQKKAQVEYLGHFSILEFLYLVDKIDTIVTSVTMALHFAIGLKKKIVMFNNIFNPNEFHFYSKNKILIPPKKCECYFSGNCINKLSCMYEISVDTAYKAILEIEPI